MFKKILVANRGEIALRIIRACKELNIPTVAVYSQADAVSMPVLFADEAVCIGPARSKESYLNFQAIIGAAEITGADAIHPGYGFLAENARFAETCNDSGISFIGPDPKTIVKMGDKALARATMIDAGVPVLPGSRGVLTNTEDAMSEAKRVGFPVMLKAVAGGGGKGMRIVRTADELVRLFNMAKSEAETAFGNGELYLERFLETPRHIEIQVMGYRDGTVLSFGERDCSIQRRHQKLIEECPSPAITNELRNQLGDAAKKAAQAVNYVGAGTIEFLLQDNEFFFMEMNTRIQVEHPVTEVVYRIDLLKEQIKACAGEKPTTLDVAPEGHAIECRINAENPAMGFAPSPGKITEYHAPGGIGVRVDSHAFANYSIPPFYDSLVAKLITFGRDREEALQRMNRALSEYILEGVFTTIPLHKQIINEETFRSGKYDTTYLEKLLNTRKTD